jgi:hypothetical protein
MKKWIIRGGIGVAALLIVAACAVFFMINSIVAKGVNTFGPKITKVDTRLGGASISVFSGKGELTDFFLGNPEGFSTPSAIKVGSVKVAVKPSSLLSDVIQVDEVNIQAPEITLEAGLSGSNLGKILDQIKGDASNTAPNKTGDATQKSQKRIYIKDLVISGGKVHMSLKGLGGKSVTAPLPDIHLREIGSPTQGATMAEAFQRVLEEISGQAAKLASEGISTVKDAGGSVVDKASKAVEGIKGIFKK